MAEVFVKEVSLTQTIPKMDRGVDFLGDFSVGGSRQEDMLLGFRMYSSTLLELISNTYRLQLWLPFISRSKICSISK